MDDKKYISGIYNYCDRWCEKCEFTSNCLLFTNESRIITHEILNNGDLTGIEDVLFDDLPDDEDDSENDFFFDDEDLPDSDFIKPEREKRPPHYLELLADELFGKGHSFLNKLNEQYKIYPPSKEKLSDPMFNWLFSRFEVISWYHTFVGAKIRRALMGKDDLNVEDDEEERAISMQDINGSAKVASIAIKRISEALNDLFDDLHEYQQSISDLLIITGKILNGIEEEFPGHKEFIRPGLD